MAVSSSALILKRPVSGRVMASVAFGVAAAAVLTRAVGFSPDSAALQTIAILFVSISVEALPFVLLGAFIAALVEVYVSDRSFARFTRLSPGLQLPVAAVGGFAFPVCECGSIPVARRFMRRGMHPGAAVAFMLAAPVFNPIVLVSTFVAYSARGLGWEMLAGRAVLGLTLAMAIGWALGTDDADELLRTREEEAGIHEHGHCDDSSAKRTSFVSHFASDFLFMGRFLVLGALLSATLQTFLPRSLIAGVAQNVIIATLVMMLVAFVSSLCSQADAFVAVSFSPFPIGSQLAFLVFGPILDFKLAFLYGGTFRKRFVSRLLITSVPVVVAGSLWFETIIQR